MLVNNIGRSTDETALLDDNTTFGQAFTVGRTVDYTLRSIDIPFAANGIAAGSIGRLDVRVWSADSSGFPARSLYTLTNPSSITADTTVSFTVPAGATLQAGRTYVVVVSYRRTLNSDQPRLLFTDNTGEDSEFAGYLETGWSIANSALERPVLLSWTERGPVLKIRVNGDFDQASADRFEELRRELIDLRCTLAGILDIKADTGARSCDRYTPDLTLRISSATETILRQLTIISQLPPGQYDFVDRAGWQTAYKGADGRIIVTKDAASWTEDLTPARAPRNLKANATAAGIVLSWQAPKAAAGEITGYQVLRRRPELGEPVLRVLVENTGSAATTFTDTGVEEGVRYTYRVTAVRGRELSGVSNARSLRGVAMGGQSSGPPPLTARFARATAQHFGKMAFRVRVAFSEAIRMSGRRLRGDVVTVSGGRVTKARPVKGRKDRWDLTVKPDSLADVTVTLASGAACDIPEAVCTKDGRALSNTISKTVRGPVTVSVADARVREAAGATLDFAVTLSRAASGTVKVAYSTADGTATAGADYTRSGGMLRFAPGETAKTVSVPVLDDAHDEGAETMRLRLAKASRARIADRVATGTIVNSDKLQQAWLARFGRTAATHVTDAVGDRLRGTPGQDSHLTVGGYRLPLGQRAAAGKPGASGAAPGAEADTDSSSLEALVTGLAGVLGLGPGQAGGTGAEPGGGLGGASWPDSGRDPRLGQSRTLDVGHALNLRQVLLGSSFRLALGGDAVGASRLRLTAWGRVAGTTFDGQDGTLSLNGDVLTGTVGVDGEWDRLLAGLAVAHSRGDGSYTMPGNGKPGQGELETTLTSVHPYLRYAVTDRLAVWGLLGFGTGQMELEVDTDEIREADTDLLMGAFGGRGILLAAAESGGFELATRTDAMLTRTTSDAVAGMKSAEADAHRLRLVLEGSRPVTWAEGRRLTPTMEVGLRHDWGDAETGFGLELGGRVQYADPALGLTIDATVRGLLAHEDSDYQEWGTSGTVRITPGAMGQGLALTLAPAWGATASGVDGLWSRQTTAGLAPQGNRAAPVGRLNAEVGYGFAPFGTGLLTPYAGTVLSDGAARTYRVGTRLQLGGPGATGLNLNLEGTRQEPAGQQPANQGLRFQLTWGF